MRAFGSDRTRGGARLSGIKMLEMRVLGECKLTVFQDGVQGVTFVVSNKFNGDRLVISC